MKSVNRANEYIQCEKIFEFLNPNCNDMISKMNEKDLKQLITVLNKYYLVLRDKLPFDENISFGLEIEFENAHRYHIDHELYKHMHGMGYCTINDRSLEDGAEISTPILYNNRETWEMISKVCNIVSRWAQIGKNSGGHIHVGANILENNSQSWLNFMKLWSVYEYIIYRFTYGEYLTARPSMDEYAAPISRCMWLDAKKMERKNDNLFEIIDFLDTHYSNDGVEFEHVKKHNSYEFKKGNTIEFRCPNGTLNPVIWQNNVNLLVNILLYSKNKDYDMDIITKRHGKTLERYFSMEMYNKIYLDVALEFCDMIFNNNLDKIYFLRQYLKSSQISKDGTYKKAKVMTLK